MDHRPKVHTAHQHDRMHLLGSAQEGGSPPPTPNDRKDIGGGVQQVVVSEVDSFSARLSSILNADMSQVGVDFVCVCVCVPNYQFVQMAHVIGRCGVRMVRM